MSELENVVGREIDWFAIDSDGELALFATAGFGFIPSSVVVALAKHQEVVRTIPTPSLGSLAVWDDYCQHGLHVYDWQHNGGPYTRVRLKHTAVESHLKELIESIPDLPLFSGHFVDAPSFDCADSFGIQRLG